MLFGSIVLFFPSANILILETMKKCIGILLSFFMPPAWKKLTGHIGLGLSVRVSVHSLRTVHAGVLKFHIWIPHGKNS